ncbi:MAG: hypothetical protein ACPGUY_09610, partial [Akkermansiaceae bacterium]
LLSCQDGVWNPSDMKSIFYIILLGLGFLASVSCERHSWEDGEDGSKGTKRLYPQEKEGHDHKGHDHAGEDKKHSH